MSRGVIDVEISVCFVADQRVIGFIDLELCTLRIDFALSPLDGDFADKETARQSAASINIEGSRGELGADASPLLHHLGGCFAGEFQVEIYRFVSCVEFADVDGGSCLCLFHSLLHFLSAIDNFYEECGRF